MPIVDYAAGDTQEYRAKLLEQIRRRKAANPNYTVVDIGGRHNPWADDVVDVYVDVFPFETDKRLYIGDVNSEDIWRELGADGPFDFVIISHVLEDIRDPASIGCRESPTAVFSAYPSSTGKWQTPNRVTGLGNPITTGSSV